MQCQSLDERRPDCCVPKRHQAAAGLHLPPLFGGQLVLSRAEYLHSPASEVSDAYDRYLRDVLVRRKLNLVLVERRCLAVQYIDEHH